MFEIVKEYLDKGIRQKIVGYLITLLIAYSLIWGIFEPLISSKQLFGENAICWWWQVQLLLTLIIGSIIFYFLLPKKALETFGFEVQDTKLNSAWQIFQGMPSFEIVNDGYYGDVLLFKGKFSYDALDSKVQPIAQKSHSIYYIYFPINRFVLYLHVNLVSKNDSKQHHAWIPLRTDISKPTGDKSGFEIGYPVKSQTAKNGWLSIKVNIPNAVNATFGHSKWKYSNLMGLRIRGEGKIQKIVIR